MKQISKRNMLLKDLKISEMMTHTLHQRPDSFPADAFIMVWQVAWETF